MTNAVCPFATTLSVSSLLAYNRSLVHRRVSCALSLLPNEVCPIRSFFLTLELFFPLDNSSSSLVARTAQIIILPRVLVVGREASRVGGLCDLGTGDLLQGVDTLALVVESVHQMHVDGIVCDSRGRRIVATLVVGCWVVESLAAWTEEKFVKMRQKC